MKRFLLLLTVFAFIASGDLRADEYIKKNSSQIVVPSLYVSNLTSGYLPYANATKQLVNSPLYTDGTNVGVGGIPRGAFHVWGRDLIIGSSDVNGEGRVFLREGDAGNDKYGVSLAYSGGGTMLGIPANYFGIVRHNGDITGNIVALISRETGNFSVGEVTATPVKFSVTLADTATNTISEMFRLPHSTSGAVADGFGSSITFPLEDEAGNTPEEAARIAALWTDGASGSESSAIAFYTRALGGAVTEAGRVASGNWTLGAASTNTVTCTGRMVLRSVTDAGPMTATAGTQAEIVFNTSDSKFYGCTVTGSPATWSALN